MPAYDFICNDCSRRFEVFLSYSEYGKKEVKCLHCGSKNTRRKMNRIRVKKSGEERFASIAGDINNPETFSNFENNPREAGRLFRKMGEELGEEMPPQFDEVVGRLESGQNMDEVDRKSVV